MEPIKPSDIATYKSTVFPAAVIEAFNELIAEKFTNGCAAVNQDAAIARIMSKMDTDRQTIYDRGWLNVEEVFIKAGWVVGYDKPAYNESYEAYFTFEVRK